MSIINENKKQLPQRVHGKFLIIYIHHMYSKFFLSVSNNGQWSRPANKYNYKHTLWIMTSDFTISKMYYMYIEGCHEVLKKKSEKKTKKKQGRWPLWLYQKTNRVIFHLQKKKHHRIQKKKDDEFFITVAHREMLEIEVIKYCNLKNSEFRDIIC